MNDQIPDVLVVGAGLVGLGIADRAAREGLRVQMLERERPGARASWAGAGMLNVRPWPRTETPDYHDLLLESTRLYSIWASRLKEETDIDIGFRLCGALELLTADRDTPQAHDQFDRLLEGCRERGVPAEEISLPRAVELEPALSTERVLRAMVLERDGQVRNPRLVKALALACRQRGVDIRERTEVSDLILDGGRIRGVVDAAGRSYPASKVVLSAGAWTGRLAQLAKVGPAAESIEPVKGQIVCYQTAPGRFSRLWTVRNRYMVPREDGLVLVGSTMEKVGYEAVTTPEGQADLEAFAAGLAPELAKAEVVNRWADLRPGVKGPHPFMGPVAGIEGLFMAAGHFRNGIGLTPVTAEILVALMTGAATPVDAGPWRPK